MDAFFLQLRQNWVIILFLGTVIMSWTMFSARLANAEEKIQQLTEVVQQINEINTNVAVIESRLGQIDKKLDLVIK